MVPSRHRNLLDVYKIGVGGKSARTRLPGPKLGSFFNLDLLFPGSFADRVDNDNDAGTGDPVGYREAVHNRSFLQAQRLWAPNGGYSFVLSRCDRPNVSFHIYEGSKDGWAANKRFEISKFKFKISRARTCELQGSFSAVQVPARVPKRAPLVKLVLIAQKGYTG